MIPQAKQITVEIGPRRMSIRMPADPESHMEQSWSEHGQDDLYFPFWLEAWPSSFGLYDYIKANSISLDGALELGCGCGVFAQLVADEPGFLIHTDLVPAACAFARQQLPATANRAVLAMDMALPCLAEAPRMVLGADIFYEYRLVELLCQFVKLHLKPGGVAYIADPMRVSRPQVPATIAATGVQHEKIVWQYTRNGKPETLAIWKMWNR